MSIKTPNNSLDEALAAIFVLMYNPLSYRGYTFAPALGYNYYLGSRFYIPQLCRFMNADVYYDTETGVLGTNMFAYCNNNPILYTDPTGFYIYSQLNTAVNTILLIVLTSYIIEFAKANRGGFNEEIFVEYLNRVTTKKTTFSNFIKRLKTSVSIISNGTLWALPSDAALLADLFDIADVKYFSKISVFLGKISFITDVLKSVYNPYLSNEQVLYNFAVYLTAEIGDIGVAKFVSDAAIAATSSSGGNVVVGVVVGIIAYLAADYITETFSDGLVYT